MAGCIDLSLWETDRAALVASVGASARDTGFLQVYNHGIAQEDIDGAFAASAAFFALPLQVKALTPFASWAGGWEKEQQVRPSTGTADLKESFQIGFTSKHEGCWPAESSLPGFRSACDRFAAGAARVSNILLRALALSLGFPETLLADAHDLSAPDLQTVLRLLYYPALDQRTGADLLSGERWRAGAHSDFDVLTLLFQRLGEDGLEVCPGHTASTPFAAGDTWIPVPPVEGHITCNIGDMLMRWSDDVLQSTLHRVRAPSAGTAAAAKPRYSIAYFNQACESTVVQGPAKKYPVLSGGEFLKQSIAANFAKLNALKEAQATV